MVHSQECSKIVVCNSIVVTIITMTPVKTIGQNLVPTPAVVLGIDIIATQFHFRPQWGPPTPQHAHLQVQSSKRDSYNVATLCKKV